MRRLPPPLMPSFAIAFIIAWRHRPDRKFCLGIDERNVLGQFMKPLYLTSGEMAARRGSVPSLDGLRAVSISIVLLAHFVNGKIFPGGLGVYVFFVISGFLITRLLLAEQGTTGTVSLKLFYARRICRLYPVIIVFATVVIVLDAILGVPFNFLEPASALGYFANYLSVYLELHGIAPQMPFEIFWSLSVEEHFYILFPVAFLCLRGDAPRLMGLVSALCVGCLAVRMGDATLHPALLETKTFYYLSQFRLDSIAFGVLLALACQTARGRAVLLRLTQPIFPLAALGVIAGCLLIRDPWFRETWRYSLLGVSITVIVSAVLFGARYHRIQRILNTGVLRWVGRLSYSLYVWHEGVASFLPIKHLPPWQQSVTNLVAAFAVAAISYYAVEQPFLALRGQFRSGGRVRSATRRLEKGI
jgi:peptidoglycan/LPS O-acetylase OafA/YrhL